MLSPSAVAALASSTVAAGSVVTSPGALEAASEPAVSVSPWNTELMAMPDRRAAVILPVALMVLRAVSMG